jgi:putative tricarboxylic transport membrane protein
MSVLGLALLAALLHDAGLWLAAPEYFAVMLLALVMVTTVAGDDAPKALFAVALGLGLGMVGIDLQTGQARFTFGVPALWNGIDPALSAIALLARLVARKCAGHVDWPGARRGCNAGGVPLV